MWSVQTLKRIDFRFVGIVLALMVISILVISSATSDPTDADFSHFFTPAVKKQIQFFAVGWVVFFLFSSMDYSQLREWTWISYLGMILLLLGLFFVPSVQNVHRWYRIGGFAFQPSEYAKMILVIALSWFLERKGAKAKTWKCAFQSLLIFGIPFLLIVKQPDLGTALVLFPIALGVFYFGGVKKAVVITMASLACLGTLCISLFFLGVLDHEKMRPIATKVLKEYQYERFNPHTYHQKASQTAIALGGFKGTGWQKSSYTKRHFLPASHTDSVFSAYVEEFGLVGALFLFLLFLGLVYLSLQTAIVAKDRFGRLLAAGIAIYLAMHIVVNIGMMCGLLPITGVPLVLISYGGSSVLANMIALGILQSIYSRRFTF